MKFLLTLVSILSFSSVISGQNRTSTSDQCYQKYNFIYCHLQIAWSELTPLINSYYADKSCLGHNMDISTGLIVYSSQLLLTGQLTCLLSTDMCSTVTDIVLVDVAGIQVNAWASLFSSVEYQFTISFIKSSIDFYVNDKSPEQYECEVALVSDSNATFFAYWQAIRFRHQTVYSKTPVCPYILKNASVHLLSLDGVAESYLLKNVWQWQNVSANGSQSSINSNITRFEIASYNVNLDDSIISALVFEQLKTVIILSDIRSLKTDLFKSFPNIHSVQICLITLVNFFHKIGIEWIAFMPNESVVVFEELGGNDDYSFIRKSYTYPDSDFCIFAQFPHRKRILPLIRNFNASASCTIVLRWLSFYWDEYNFNDSIIGLLVKYDSDEMTVESLCYNPDYRKLDMRYFENQIDLCRVKWNDTKQKFRVYTDLYDYAFNWEFADDLFVFVLIPCGCIIGFLLNLLVIRIINKNEKKELKEDFYKFMRLNSKLNCIYCLILVFYPINYCNDYRSGGLFCSAVNTSPVVQYFKIIFIAYLAETLKMCSNFAYILISVNRYMLIGKDHSESLRKFTKLNYKLTIAIFTLFSAVFNIGHGFQYFIQTQDEPIKQFEEHGGYFFTYPAFFHSDRLNALSVYSFGYFVINFFLFLVINTFVEAMIVLRLRRELSEKRKRLAVMSELNRSSQQASDQQKKKLEEDEARERRVLIMVLLNSGINFVLRSPEILFFLIQAGVLTNLSPLDYESTALYVPFLPQSLLEFSYFTYILTFCSNVTIYYFFNQKFKEAFEFWSLFFVKESEKK